MDESEVATMQYVAKHTPTIPVPKMYLVNHNHNHVVGAAFILIERLPGIILWNLWDELSMSHKKSVLSQIAGVVAQLTNLKFDEIGSLTESGIGPVLQQGFITHNVPFDTLEDTFYGMTNASPFVSCCDECKGYCESARFEVKKFFETPNPVLDHCKAPFSLQHGDFSSLNILFKQDDPDQPPVLRGLIECDGTGTNPAYYTFDHAGLLITDDFREPQNDANDRILRKHYVRALAGHFPPGSTGAARCPQVFPTEVSLPR